MGEIMKLWLGAFHLKMFWINHPKAVVWKENNLKMKERDSLRDDDDDIDTAAIITNNFQLNRLFWNEFTENLKEVL